MSTNHSSVKRPDQIKDWLDRFVIGQDEAKKTLSVAVANHYKRIRHNSNPESETHIDKSNVILLGPTGCGKTMMVRMIAKYLDVPCYIQDCTKITESGYVGSDVEDCLAGLLRQCNFDMEKVKRGIVVLDEGDKLAKVEAGPSITRDVGGVGVQQSLLKIVEGDLVGVPPQGGRKHPEQPLLYVDTTNILFILTGAFVGLEDIIRRRTGQGAHKIGFSGPGSAAAEVVDSDSILDEATPEDLRKFGLIPEFIGRFPVITHVDNLDRDSLVRILSEPENSLLAQYRALLAEDGVEFDVSEDALERIADEAIRLGTGARGLRAVLEKVMRDLMYELPKKAARKKNMSYTLTAEDVEGILRKNASAA
jgi:ATP-dependent Clp protease ATP-binding subunit ClpX